MGEREASTRLRTSSAHLLTREDDGQRFYVCDEYDIDAYNQSADLDATCVNDFPTNNDAYDHFFGGETDCDDAADGVFGTACSGHGVFIDDEGPFRDVMGPSVSAAIRELRTEYDQQTRDHLALRFSEIAAGG